MRFYPMRNIAGQIVPDTYIVVMDYNGVNYDYNDNMYVLQNVRPETPAP
jgi:hypothetical protein